MSLISGKVCGASKVRFPTLIGPQHDEVHSGGEC